MRKLYKPLDKNKLYQLYVIDKLSTPKIAKLLNVPFGRILYQLKKYRFKIRHPGSMGNEIKFNKKEYMKSYYKKYYKNNQIKLLEVAKKYREINKLKISKYLKKYHKRNKNKSKDYNRKYYLQNQSKLIEQAKINQKKRRLEIIEYRKKYYQDNKRKINQTRQYKYNTNINFKIRCRLAIRIWDALKNNSKSTKTIELLGCSLEFLKYHLESQFKPDMNWNNYSLYGWHIDHIIPCASFDLSKEEEQRKCFHYTNLQPLWAKENWSKNKYE